MKYFKPTEFTNFEKMHPDFLTLLDEARGMAQVPFKITSSYREGDEKAHGFGVAVDISCPEKAHGRERFGIITSLLSVGINRIGVYDRHIHADMGDRIDPEKFPSNVVWWGQSR